MVSQGDLESDAPDDHEAEPPETTVTSWYGTITRDGRSVEAAFVATDRRLIYVTEATETTVEYARVRSVETDSEGDGEAAESGYRDLAVGAVAFTAVGLAIAFWSDRVIGSVVGVIGVLIGVLLALDVARNVRDHSGRMTLETTVYRLELTLVDGDSLSITTTEDVGAELRRLVADAGDH